MTTKEQLHALVEALPESQLDAAAAALEPLADPVLRALLMAPEDDEPLTAEEQAAIAESRAAYGRGEFVAHDELKRRLGL